MKKAREVIADAFADWAYEQDHESDSFGGEIFYRLNEAGYVILPKEPSEEMIEAIRDAINSNLDNIGYADDPYVVAAPDAPSAVYRAMISTVGEEK